MTIVLERNSAYDMEIKGKVEEAMNLRAEGYNCAQAVLMPYSDTLGMPRETLALISAGLGGGAGQGELCGVANALAIAEGILQDDPSGEGKKKAVAGAKRLGEEFSRPYGGCVTCRALKGKFGKSCHELVAEGIVILGGRIKNC